METMTEARTQTDKRIDDLRSDTAAGFERTDKRIDDLRSDIRAGFERLETEMRAGFGRVDADIREIRAAIGSMQRLMIVFFGSTLGTIVAGVAVAVLVHS